ncbi:MAG: CPBP family intramembrane metalloprotease [Coriobacteriales bacterium]|jgi:membrane protease YdiL (CAAX protease family)|nr:CPBP family intramembrane metalloprotease [Coriobacteriales bacterium]
MVTYLVLIVVSGVNINRMYRGVFVSENERVSVYWQSIGESWVAAIVLGACSLLAGFRIDTDLGLGIQFFQFNSPLILTAAVLIAAGAFAIFTALQLINLAGSNTARVQAWRQISDGANRNVALKDVGQNLLIPRSAREKDLFTLLSLSAAICEEFTLRGVLFMVIQTMFADLPLPLIPLIAGVIFGVAHCYQGPRGVLKTGIVGIGFGYLYLVCGSLVPGIILHFLVDFTNRFIFPDEFPLLKSGQPSHRDF